MRRMNQKFQFIATLVALILSPSISMAQESALLTHYYDLQSIYSPAATGMQKTLKVALDARLDSIGADHTSRNIFAVVEAGKDFEKIRIGAGIVYNQGHVSCLDRKAGTLNLSVGYRLGNGMLSIGISPGIMRGEVMIGTINSELDDNKAKLESRAETSEEGALKKKTNTFDIGAGIYFTDHRLWVSASALHLNAPRYRYRRAGILNGEESSYQEETIEAAPRTYYFTAGYNITIKKSLFDLVPSFIVAVRTKSTQFQADARLIFKKLIHFGLGWRSKNTGIVLAGIEYKGFHLMYGYEHGFSAPEGSSRFNGHEVLAAYAVDLDLNRKKKYRQKSIRIL